ncbi:chorismate mutase [Vitreoscilla massiliensis]|uniref:Chorismate mutase n=1 Tax=Vitreoscilla massiliensis TaxID=1689272 RepID=A0ABY4DZA7_9NEIS|nr:chorismate mutase [Vitreoscilla massiliensis]UOO88867.1 chorismate mutase [Vitreoscilla massiliensis]
MIIVMQPHAEEQAIKAVIEHIRAAGLHEHVSVGAERVIIGAVGDERVLNVAVLEQLPQVERAVRIVHDWRIISREAQPQNSVYVSRGVALGQDLLSIYIKRPVNSAIAYLDPFYVPSNPYQAGVQSEEQQLRLLPAEVSGNHQQNKPVMVRVRDLRQLDGVLFAGADIVYLGGEWLESRSMQQEIGRLNLPVVVCKDKHHTLEQWLVAAERVAMYGNHQIVLGEAGTLSINHRHPYRLDVEAIAEAVKHSHLPVLANVTRLGNGLLSQEQLSQLAEVAGARIILRND